MPLVVGHLRLWVGQDLGQLEVPMTNEQMKQTYYGVVNLKRRNSTL